MAQDASYFRGLTNPSLDFAIKDIKETLEFALLGPQEESKYLDQLHCALAEKRRREGKDCCPTCKRPL